ncbi:MAG: hypothetical protein H0V86_01240 [Chloroflexia bacterium]|nr:hypothetical protein [Chloroflexia bacterium]
MRRGAMATRDIVVPAEHVSEITEGRVSLRLTVEQLERLEDFRMHRYVDPASDLEPMENADPPGVIIGAAPAVWTGEPTNAPTVGGAPLVVEEIGNVPEGAVAFSPGQEVLTQDGAPLGQVRRLSYDGEQFVGIIVSPEDITDWGRLVTVDLVLDVAVDDLVLSVDPASFEALPEVLFS